MSNTTHQNVFNVDNEIQEVQSLIEENLNSPSDITNRTVKSLQCQLKTLEYHSRISETLKNELDKFLTHRDTPITYNTLEDIEDELKVLMSTMMDKSEEIFKEYISDTFPLFVLKRIDNT